MWFISSWEENKHFVKLSKFIKWHSKLSRMNKVVILRVSMWFWSVSLANQFSSQFLIFFGQPKENWTVTETEHFISPPLLKFLSSLYRKMVTLRRVNKRIVRSLRQVNFFLDNWSAKRLTETIWTSFLSENSCDFVNLFSST